MLKSDSIASLAAALSKAQAMMKPALKDSENPHFRSRYADLASTWEACRDALTKNGLSVVQLPQISEHGAVAVETILLHDSGEYLAGTVEIPVTKQDAQGIGSAITYARRYSLAAAVGIAPDDDDGEAAVGRSASGAQNRPVRHDPPAPHTPAPPSGRDAELHRRIGETLRTLYGDDKTAALEEVERLTAFTGKDGTPVAGVRDFYKLTGKRLEILAAKLSDKLKNAPPTSAPLFDDDEPF